MTTPQARKELTVRLYRDFNALKTYGKEPEAIESIVSLFNEQLAEYPIEKINAAFKIWYDRSSEFPTPHDIVTLIKRRGRPPLKQSMYIAISEKEGQERTPQEWQYMRDYEAEQHETQLGFGDDAKETAHEAEMMRLRQQVADLRRGNTRLTELLLAERFAKTTPGTPVENPKNKIETTVAHMQSTGRSKADIDEFIASMGGAHG